MNNSSPDQIFYNGNIITMAENENPEAVAVTDGKISFVGKLSEILNDESFKNHKRVDLKGRTLMTSFIDPHSHFTSVATSFLEISLEDAQCFEDICEKIKNYIKTQKPEKGKWIVAKGYDQNFLKEKDHPRAAVLDKASQDYPVIIHHRSGHMGVFNSKAMEILKIDKNTQSPNGGNIEKKEGVPTGYMEENAFIELSKKVPMPSLEDMKNAYIKAQEKYASYGITTIQEGMTVDQLLPMYEMLKREKVLFLDTVCYCGIDSGKVFTERFSEHKGKYKDRIKIGGYKILLDGSPQGRTAWMRKPYENSKDYCGYNTMSDEAVYSSLKKALDDNMQLLAHCNGDRAVQQYLEAAEKLKSQGCEISKIRPVIVHGQLMGTDQLKEAADLGFIASFFVAHVYHWGEIHLENFGKERGSHISPAGSALKDKMIFTFHQDSPVIEPDMAETIWSSVVRETPQGICIGEEEKIPVYEALKAVTVNAAYQYFEEKDKGTIEKGKKADLIILDKNPLTCKNEELKNLKVLRTMKEGKTVYCRDIEDLKI